MVIPTMDLETDLYMGQTINFTVQPKLIRLFDKETGNNLIWYDHVYAEANAPECAGY